MSVKNAIATGMLVFGLVLSILGFQKKAPEVVTEEVKETKVELRNSDSLHFNWRALLGFLTVGTGFLLYAFPSQKDLEARRYGDAE